MKLIPKIFAVSTLALLVNCTATQNAAAGQSVKTYAELSVKEGGQWNGKKYEGGTFRNVNELTLPSTHTDHSYYIRYEGPGWESNKVGYRLYLDWRNAIDIFGKLTEDMVLQDVGQDGFDSYHNMSDWGADILKVGKGLGIGSIGRIVNYELLHFNKVEKTSARVQNSTSNSKVFVDYKGWETNGETTDLSSELTIFPNQRYTRHTIQSSEAMTGIVTGIVNLYKLPAVKKTSTNGKWGYVATFGKQTLFNDDLGMAVFYRTDDVNKVFEGATDHLVEFKPTTKKITFYFLGAWEKEINGIKTEADFVKYLDENLNKLNQTNELN